MLLSVFDIVLLAPLVFGFFRGLLRGFVKELAAVAGIIIAIFATFLFADLLVAWAIQLFPELAMQARVVSYLLVFFGVLLVINLLASLLTKFLKMATLGWINTLLGGIFGLVKWLILVSLFCYFLFHIQTEYQIFQKSTFKDSVLFPFFLELGALFRLNVLS